MGSKTQLVVGNRNGRLPGAPALFPFRRRHRRASGVDPATWSSSSKLKPVHRPRSYLLGPRRQLLCHHHRRRRRARQSAQLPYLPAHAEHRLSPPRRQSAQLTIPITFRWIIAAFLKFVSGVGKAGDLRSWRALHAITFRCPSAGEDPRYGTIWHHIGRRGNRAEATWRRRPSSSTSTFTTTSRVRTRTYHCSWKPSSAPAG